MNITKINHLNTDEEVVEYVRSVEQNEYRIIVERYQDKLYRYVNRMTKNSDASADIVQQCFIKAFKNLQSFDVNRKFSSWIYRIAHNETMNYLKKNKRQVQLDDSSLIDKLFHRGNNVIEDTMEKKELSKMMQQIVDELPTDYQAPLSLFFFEDKSYEEISEILRIPVSTVGTRIRRGKQRVKELYVKRSFEGEK